MKTKEPTLAQVLGELRELRQDLKSTRKRLLSVDETAAYLGISPKSIRNRLGPKAEKPFPVRPVRVAGRVVFKKEDLDRFIDGLGVGE